MTYRIDTVLLARACGLSVALTALTVAPALACRGTAEFPQAYVQIAEANLPLTESDALFERLEAGEALHHLGHELDNRDVREESLAILDEIMARLAQ